MTDASSIPTNSHAIVLTEVVEMGGAERSCLALARWLHKQGLESHFVTYQDKTGLEQFASHPLRVVQLRPRMDPVHKALALHRYFAAQVKTQPPLMSGYQAALYASLAGMRGFHCLMHDTPSLFSCPTKKASLRDKIRRSISDKMTAHGIGSGGRTIVTSEYLRDETRRVFGVDAAVVRMGGLAPTAGFRPRPVTASLRMLSVSRVEPNKRIDWMVRALAALESETPSLSSQLDWRLDVAGKGSSQESLQTMTKELGVDERIHFHGFVSDAELQDLYERAELFLMPAVQGYGIPAIESLQRGIPVLLHRDSGVSDILLDTPWATVLEGDESSMIPGLKRAIEGVRLRRQFAVPLPALPTEDSWAAEVARLCGWV